MFTPLLTHDSLEKYGKLSDIYGRKTLVIAAYVIFVVGWYVFSLPD